MDYSESWRRLCQSSRVPILTGENLTRREGVKDFIINQGCDIVNPDLRNTGGFLETKPVVGNFVADGALEVALVVLKILIGERNVALLQMLFELRKKGGFR